VSVFEGLSFIELIHFFWTENMRCRDMEWEIPIPPVKGSNTEITPLFSVLGPSFFFFPSLCFRSLTPLFPGGTP
jgi:hypothetical protein